MSSGLSIFLDSLKTVNEFLKLPERPDPRERVVWLETILKEVLENPELELDPRWTPRFKQEFKSSSLVCLKVILNHHKKLVLPKVSLRTRALRVGIVSLHIGGPLWLRLLLEKLLPALALDNAVFLLPARDEDSPTWLGPSEKQLQVIRDLLIQRGMPTGAIHTLPFDPSLEEFIYCHPGVKAHFVYLPPHHPNQAKLSGVLGIEVFRTKKIQCFWGGKSAAAVLPGADLKTVATQLAEGIMEGGGSTPWNISRIFVVESLEKALIQELKLALQGWSDTYQPGVPENLPKEIQRICKKQGHNLSPTPAAALLENISNCDESHQRELGLPLAALTPVKYPHEVNKWLGSLSNLVNLYCYGDAERVKAIANKSEAASVIYNQLLNQIEQPLLHGHKESWWGLPSSPGQHDALFYWPQRRPEL